MDRNMIASFRIVGYYTHLIHIGWSYFETPENNIWDMKKKYDGKNPYRERDSWIEGLYLGNKFFTDWGLLATVHRAYGFQKEKTNIRKHAAKFAM